ncbi:MAG: lipocalin-like domain-containing protein, partial [Pikeienuella sp.]
TASDGVEQGPAALLEAFAAAASGAGPEAGFARLGGPWTLALPTDHGAHPAARSESWTVAAHLLDETGRRIGVQLAFARFGIDAPDAGAAPTGWDVSRVHRAHVVLAEDGAAAARAEERLSRGAFASAGQDPAAGAIWIDDWRLAADAKPDGPGLTLTATLEGMPLHLVLSAERDPIQIDADGTGPVRGYVLSRLAVEGRLGEGPEARALAGVAWLDHVWGELPLPVGPVASDRLILHLDDGTELSILRTRRRDGRGAATVDALFVAADGTVNAGASPDVEMAPHAPAAARDGLGAYPLSWQLKGPGLTLDISPLMEAQRHAFAMPLWSGAVIATGRRDGAPIAGVGTLQLTGYEMP